MKFESVDGIAIAALLHDIGKFAQRADVTKKDSIYRDKDYKYAHAAFSAEILHRDYFSLGEYADIAAGHHAPKSDDEWVIAVADRIASGFERDVFEQYNSADRESFKEQRLWYLFDEKKRYKIDILSPQNIFASDVAGGESEYKALWQKFEEDMKRISKHGNSATDSFTIDYLLRKYCTFIPSSTSFQKGGYEAVKANIPLYEHSKATAVFASAIYKLKESGNTNIIDCYRDKSGDVEQKDFLYIAGDFFGIQKFIFDSVPAAKASKILRAKSAFVQILVRVIALDIVRKLGLSSGSIISTHAGKFEILGINDNATKERLAAIQKELDEFFVGRFFGETGVGLSFVECSMGDFVTKGRYKESLRKKLADAVEAKKYSKFDLQNRDSVLNYDDGLDNQNLCPLCGKRKKIDDEACEVCGAFVRIGEKLAKANYMKITTDSSHGGLHIYGDYYIQFEESDSVFVDKNSDIVVFDIANDAEFRGYAKWELASYVRKDEKKAVLTFEDLAENSCGGRESKEGIKAIMSLKGDVDGMGAFLSDSKNELSNSFARYNFFARMMDCFFSVYASDMMKGRNIYTVFAGGDDIFILGAWDEVIEFAKELRAEFMRFAEGSNLTISMGLVLTKPNKPINFVAHMAEEGLDEAKSLSGKDAVTIFGETVKWDDYLDDGGLIEALMSLGDEKLNTALLYRLLEFVNMSKNIKDDIKNALWKSKLRYSHYRNIGDKHEELLKILDRMIEKYPSETKVFLSELVYKRRQA